jgi:hypothetical protein
LKLALRLHTLFDAARLFAFIVSRLNATLRYGNKGRVVETGEVPELPKPSLEDIKRVVDGHEKEKLAKGQNAKALEHYFSEQERRKVDCSKMTGVLTLHI